MMFAIFMRLGSLAVRKLENFSLKFMNIVKNLRKYNIDICCHSLPDMARMRIPIFLGYIYCLILWYIRYIFGLSGVSELPLDML
jgi:hypothetical protein